jgi:uncharacterized protein (DUF1684 family)
MFSSGCKRYSPEEESYIKTIIESRAKKDAEMKSEPTSPFNRDTNTHYAPLKYFDVDPAFVFKSILTRYANPDTVITYGTKGEERKAVRIGYLAFEKDGSSYKINVYKGKSKSGEEYHSIWFTDLTTAKETYGVGRYIDFEVNPDTLFVYTLDFNLAYSPYCSYSAIYSCAIPTKEDFINLRIEAGEKKFHQ